MSTWLKSLISAVIGGAAGAGADYLAGVVSGKPIDFKAMGIAIAIGALSVLFAYLKQSPMSK